MADKIDPIPTDSKFKFLKITNLKFEVDPVQDDQIRDACARNSGFAELLFRDKTGLFFDFLEYKVKYRENITLEVKGQTRSGKSTLAIAVCMFIANLNGVPFEFKNICANEIEYLQKVKSDEFEDGSVFLIDEQTESIDVNEKVLTQSGAKRIGDCREGEKIWIMSFNVEFEKIEFKEATKVDNKKKVIYEVKTESGKTVRATADHIFYIREENGKITEKKLNELREGDKLICL